MVAVSIHCVWVQFAASYDLLPPSSVDDANANLYFPWCRINWCPNLSHTIRDSSVTNRFLDSSLLFYLDTFVTDTATTLVLLKLVESDISNLEHFSSLSSIGIPDVYIVKHTIPSMNKSDIARDIPGYWTYRHNKPLSEPQLACPQANTYPKSVIEILEQLCTRENKQENKCNRIE